MKKYNSTCKSKDKFSDAPFVKECSATDLADFANEKLLRTGECPPTHTNASARGLAKLAGAMANKGTLNGKKILSEEAWE